MALTHGGGRPNVRDVNKYAEPTGPKRDGGMTNIGKAGTQQGGGAPSSSGTKGIGGTSHGNRGSQKKG